MGKKKTSSIRKPETTEIKKKGAKGLPKQDRQGLAEEAARSQISLLLADRKTPKEIHVQLVSDEIEPQRVSKTFVDNFIKEWRGMNPKGRGTTAKKRKK